jgi:hypothetical protein
MEGEGRPCKASAAGECGQRGLTSEEEVRVAREIGSGMAGTTMTEAGLVRGQGGRIRMSGSGDAVTAVVVAEKGWERGG